MRGKRGSVLPLSTLLLHPKAVAVHTLSFGGIGLVGADLNGVQSAVILTLAMVGAIADRAVDAGIGGARAAVGGAVAGSAVAGAARIAVAEAVAAGIVLTGVHVILHYERSS